MEPLSLLSSAPPDLTGRVAVVTGGAQGIGREVAMTLSAVGARVMVWDLEPVTFDDLDVSEGTVDASVVDVSDSTQVMGALDNLLNDWGRFDVLVNNAGLGDRTPLAEVDQEFWQQRGNINVFGMIACTQAAYPVMADQGGGKIVNVSSVSAKVGGVTSEDPGTGLSRSGPVYSATKGAVISFTRWIAKTGGRGGILANSVCPGPVATPAIEGAVYDLSATPVDRLGTTQDVAQAVLYFGSQMSNYVTGQSLNVDGGLRFD